MIADEVLRVLERGWWDGTPESPTEDLVGLEGVRIERDGARWRVEIRAVTAPHELDQLLARVRPQLGSGVRHVVLDLHGVPDGDVQLVRALDRLRLRVLLHGVPVEVTGGPSAWRARWDEGRTVHYRVEEQASSRAGSGTS